MKIETIEDVAGLPCPSTSCDRGQALIGDFIDTCELCKGTGLAFWVLSDPCQSQNRSPSHQSLCSKPLCLRDGYCPDCHGTGRIVNAMLERCLDAAEGIGVWKLIQTIPKGYGMVIKPCPGRPGKPVGKFGDTPLEAAQAALVAAAKERYESTQH